MTNLLIVLFLTWTLPTQNIDGSPLDSDSISGYQVWCAPPGGEYRQVVKTWRLNHHPGWVGTGGMCCKVRTVAENERGRETGPFTEQLCVAVRRVPELEVAPN
jgi:hypothetical protein